jgi:thymidine phosphorylase
VVDPAVGLVLKVTIGDRVERGQPLVVLHHRSDNDLRRPMELLQQACEIGETPPAKRALIHETITSEGLTS